jgi:hypothetical protein
MGLCGDCQEWSSDWARAFLRVEFSRALAIETSETGLAARVLESEQKLDRFAVFHVISHRSELRGALPLLPTQ